MSCRRKDRRNLVGCNIGDVAVGGCSRGCCHYSDDKKFERNHPHISTHPLVPPEQPFEPPPDVKELYQKQGRTNLRWKSCGAASYKPKFICVQCRRMFKPFYDEDAFEYSITRFGWRVRPSPAKTENKELRAAIEYSKYVGKRGTQRRLDELIDRYNIGHDPPINHRSLDQIGGETVDLEPLSQEEINELKSMEPEVWWTDLIMAGNDHRKRCPGCSAPGTRVGSKFRVPGRTDDRGWQEVSKKLEAGDDMIAGFEVCATLEDYREMIIEAERLKKLETSHDGWMQEKRRRQTELGLAVARQHA